MLVAGFLTALSRAACPSGYNIYSFKAGTVGPENAPTMINTCRYGDSTPSHLLGIPGPGPWTSTNLCYPATPEKPCCRSRWNTGISNPAPAIFCYSAADFQQTQTDIGTCAATPSFQVQGGIHYNAVNCFPASAAAAPPVAVITPIVILAAAIAVT